MKMEIEIRDENGDEASYDIPAKYEVCSRCDGKGTHVNPAIECKKFLHKV